MDDFNSQFMTSVFTPPAPVQEEPWDLDGSIIMYGVFCDLALIIPIVLYFALEDTLSCAENHMTYINMIFSAYTPIGIIWWILVFADS